MKYIMEKFKNNRIKFLLTILGIILLSVVFKVCYFDWNYDMFQLIFTMIIASGNTFTILFVIYLLDLVIKEFKNDERID